MDEYNRKRSVGGPSFSRKSSNLSLREQNHEDRNVQYCNRLGCSTRLNTMKGVEIGGSPEKPKARKLSSFSSTNSKSIGGTASSSSKLLSTSTNSKKSNQKRPSRASCGETMLTEGSELSSTATGIQAPSSSQRLSALSRPGKQNSRRVESNDSDIPSSSSSSSSSSSIRPPLTTRSTGQARAKNLSCSTISDVLPSGCSSSSSDLGKNKRVASVRKRPSNGDKGTSSSSSSSLSGTNGSEKSRQDSRRARYQPVNRDAPVSVRTRRAPSGEARTRLHERQDDNTLSISEPVLYPQIPPTQLTIREPSPIFRSSLGGRPNSSGRVVRSSRLVSSRLEDGSTHGPSGARDRDSYRRVHMEGIAEVLLALERIEHDDELTYEQLMVLETNLLLGGFSFRDQHRDMRLDIDNMTYEELLALEEKMGTVSTALSEEELSKCLKKSSYMPSSQLPGIIARGDDDVKCSICQEEYGIGDEVGKLACDHRYHVDCIEQWLRQKNWCPICKTSVVSHAENKEE